MRSISGMSLILVLLLLLTILFSGCSIIGYTVGTGIDYSTADKELVADASTLQPGDVLLLKWKDGHAYHGWVISVDGPDSVKIGYNANSYRVETYLSELVIKGQVDHVEKIDKKKSHRYFGLGFGLFFDLVLVYLIFALTHMGVPGN